MSSTAPRWIALVDCTNFYASCERAFNPALWDRPVAVLSNNDGCVIARSAAVKAAGVPMGAPYFKWKGRLRAIDAAVFSSNYELYGDMSRRVMTLLAQDALELAVYSIDEAFLVAPDYPRRQLHAWTRRVRQRIWGSTGIPVRIGIGSTKTLAKLANRWAKREPDGVMIFPGGDAPQQTQDQQTRDQQARDQQARKHLMTQTPTEAVWGIGPAFAQRLAEHGVTTTWDLHTCPVSWVRRTLGVTGARVALELRGTPCRPLDEQPACRKSLVRSRSFGTRISEQSALREALCTRVSRAAEKLRAEALTARGLQVFITTKRFGDGPHHRGAAGGHLPTHTASTPKLARATGELLERIYRPGIGYKKAGVLLYDLRPKQAGQPLALFEASGAAASEGFVGEQRAGEALMGAVDTLNAQYGRGTVQLASCQTGEASGKEPAWAMKRNRTSPRYTTRWADLPVAQTT